MSTKFMPNLELPAEVRAVAEKNVTQARQAFETLFNSAREAVGKSEGHFEEVRSGVRDLRQKTLGLVEANVAASFDFLNKLVAAKSPQEMMTLQSEFLQSQLKAVTEQAKSLGEEAKSLGEATVRSLEENARGLADRVKALTAAATQQAQATAQDLKAMGEAVARDVKATGEQVSNVAGQTFDPNRSQ